GRIGEKTLGVPCLLLTVSGRTTAKAQIVALAYANDGGSHVVVASNGGQDDSPDWFENLRHNPAVTIQIGRSKSPATAEVVDRNDHRYERLWRIVNANN